LAWAGVGLPLWGGNFSATDVGHPPESMDGGLKRPWEAGDRHLSASLRSGLRIIWDQESAPMEDGGMYFRHFLELNYKGIFDD